MIGLLDYGLGNISALENIYRRLAIPVRRVSGPGEFRGITRLVLPGVGAFDWAMSRLAASGLLAEVNRLVCEDRIPVLGIRVGMQMMATRSDEGVLPGLGWVPGEVRRLSAVAGSGDLMLPHMGWNEVTPRAQSSIFECIPPSSRFYFLHSYHLVPFSDEHASAYVDYGGKFVCGDSRGNVYGVQFHPEKSHAAGVQVLKSFARI